MLQRAIAALGASAEDCIFVGDSAADMEAGRGKLPVAAYPGVARFAYQLGRALLAAGATADAKVWIEKAAAAE